MYDFYPEFFGNSTFLGSDDVFWLGSLLTDNEFSVYSAIRPLLAETAMFGVFSLLFFLVVCVFVRKNLRRVPNALMLSAVVVLYTSATLHWVSQLLLVGEYKTLSAEVTGYASRCLLEYAAGRLCEVLPDFSSPMAIFSSTASMDQRSTRQGCLATSVLTVNISLSDSIVLWRAWVLWNRNRVFLAISLALLLGSIAMSSVALFDACDTFHSKPGSEGDPLFEADVYGLAAFILSLVTNLQHRRLIKRHLRQGSARTRAEKVMALFIESGVVYCLIWIFIVAYDTLDFYYDFGTEHWSTAGLRLINAWRIFVDGALLQVIGIYPTIVIVLVALEKSHLDTYDGPVPVPPEIPPRRVAITVDTETETHHQTLRNGERSYVLDIRRDGETQQFSCVKITEDSSSVTQTASCQWDPDKEKGSESDTCLANAV
ncbi:hypothetical protein OF83DRAFT_1175737 [Amylostereum chailletii]|nr:hypothetical protein OF83DRAFT_1175737 [Amylostereum chailletii]